MSARVRCSKAQSHMTKQSQSAQAVRQLPAKSTRATLCYQSMQTLTGRANLRREAAAAGFGSERIETLRAIAPALGQIVAARRDG